MFSKILLLLLLIVSSLSATTRYVCTSGTMEDGTACGYTNLQDAITAANPGDTIIGKAGDGSTEGVRVRLGKHDITIKSSKVDKYPRNTRISRDSSNLFRIGSIEFGAGADGSEDTAGYFNTQGATNTDTLTNAPGNGTYPSAHYLSVGEWIVLGAGLFQPIHCGSLEQEPYTTQCNADTVGFFNLRAVSGLQDGSVVYFRVNPGVTLPSPLVPDTPYYVRDYYPGVHQSPGHTNCSTTVPENGWPVMTVNACVVKRALTTGMVLDIPAATINYVSGAGYARMYLDSGGLKVITNGDLVVSGSGFTNEGTGSTIPDGAQGLYAMPGYSGGWWRDNGGQDLRPWGMVDKPRFKLAASPGGAAISVTPYDPYGQQMNMEVPPYPVTNGTRVCVLEIPDPTTFKVGTTCDPSSKITFTGQFGHGWAGAGYGHGAYYARTRNLYNITFDGIEIKSDAYYVVNINNAFGAKAKATDPDNNQGEIFGLKFLRCWIHDDDQQKDLPMATMRIGSRDTEVGWSILEGAWSNSFDNQGIAMATSGNVDIHDNYISSGGQGIFSGGNFPPIAPWKNANKFRIYRNRITAHMKFFRGLTGTYVSASSFKLGSYYSLGATDCATASSAADISQQCFWYSGTDLDPANNTITRRVWTANAANSTFAFSADVASGNGVLYGKTDGNLYFDYYYNGGAVTTTTCPTGITCTAKATLAEVVFPSGSTRIGEAQPGFGSEPWRVTNTKARIESKGMDHALIEGNVLERQTNTDGGILTQDNIMQMTVALNGSEPSAPVNYSASTSYNIIRNNIIRHGGSAINMNGKSYGVDVGSGQVAWEWAGFAKNEGTRITNNLIYDVGSAEYTMIYNNGHTIRTTFVKDMLFEHNTAMDVKGGTNLAVDVTTPERKASRLYWRNNIFSPLRGNCDLEPGACTNANSNTMFPGVAGYYWRGYPGWSAGGDHAYASGAGNISSEFENNIVANRAGSIYTIDRPTYYPASTYLNNSAEATSAQPDDIVETWVERGDSDSSGSSYRGVNFNLKAGNCTTFAPTGGSTGKCLGADIDEIEALTGPNGDDVVAGIPPFFERTVRRIDPGTTTATISYLPSGSACTITIYTDTGYRTQVSSGSDSSSPLVDGRVVFDLTGLSTSTTYAGKRRCGTAVDVFTFTTLASVPAVSMTLKAPSGASDCVVEHGTTSSLGSTTTAVSVSGGRCTVSVPTTAGYWRHAYRDGSGNVLARGTIRTRGL